MIRGRAIWLLLAGALIVGGAGTRANDAGTLPISIGVSPPRVELNLGSKPVSQAMRVYNFGNEAADIRVSVHNWTLDTANQVQLLPPDEQSLDQWMVINPVAFTIAPGEYQTVRFAVRPKVAPEAGEHRAILYFTQRPLAQPASNDGMTVVGRLGAAVYAYVGEVERRATLDAVLVDVIGGTPVAHFDVNSAGTAHVRLDGHYSIWPVADYPGAANTQRVAAQDRDSLVTPEGAVASGWLPRLPVLPDAQRTLSVPLPEQLAPGRYVLDVDGEIGGARIDIGVPFSVTDVATGAIDDDGEGE